MQVAHTTYGVHSVTEPSFTAALLHAAISISAFPAWRLLDKHDQACAAEVLRPSPEIGAYLRTKVRADKPGRPPVSMTKGRAREWYLDLFTPSSALAAAPSFLALVWTVLLHVVAGQVAAKSSQTVEPAS